MWLQQLQHLIAVFDDISWGLRAIPFFPNHLFKAVTLDQKSCAFKVYLFGETQALLYSYLKGFDSLNRSEV